MHAVLLVVHVIIALALIGIILIQRSDSDGFGLGSGSGSNFMSGRSAANFLTRTTAILATLFIANSLLLGVLAANRKSDSIVDVIAEQQQEEASPAKEDKALKEVSENKDVKKSEPVVPTE